MTSTLFAELLGTVILGVLIALGIVGMLAWVSDLFDRRRLAKKPVIHLGPERRFF